ncbi:xanthine dehydrogenase family protein molybdopterin-binding subunit [Rhodoligotrophos defluvii]|uniref:xanthine dehydrogenase family protein molybdopterin-binding subunit n=1 Tax=Rhodoligotrophos defluvii TaxID=2561934 RepID=UPI001EF1265E|nr:xanthine dehydrogenase family protein molybdopterin-binding subunit [Rhodoligotrophos defluvii]
MKFAVGQAVRRREDERFLKGAGRYLDDMVLPDMVHAAVVRSPHAHARIRGIDLGDALAAPGVVAIYTAADVQAAGLGILPTVTGISGVDKDGIRHPPRYALTGGVVKHVGDPVAFVVAGTRQQARDAADRVIVEYEDLPAVTSTARALDADAPLVWPEFGTNRCYRFHKGDRAATDEAFARAARVVSLDLVNNRLAPAAIEPRCAIGEWDEAAEQYVLYVSGQAVHSQQSQMAGHVFKTDLYRIRVVAPDVGGGFGGKNFVYPENVMVMFAARQLGRPVKWVADRAENFMAEIHGRDHVTHAELALDETAKILGLRVKTMANMGAYLSSFGPYIPAVSMMRPTGGNYAIPAIDLEVHAVFTNTVPVDAYRGAGRPEAAYVIERLMDVAAFDLGMAPEELRRRNFISTYPYTTALGSVIDSGDFQGTLDQALALIDWNGFPARKQALRAAGRLRGRGIGSYLEMAVGNSSEEPEIRFDEDGGVTVLVGTHSTGQGHETAFVQIISTELGIPAEKIRYVQGDTNLIPTGGGHGGSRSLVLGGSAVYLTAGEIREKARLAASHLLEAGVGDLVFEDGRFTIAGTDRSIHILDIERQLRSAERLPEGVPSTLTTRIRYDGKAVNFPNGCHICEVEIEPDTGRVLVDRYVVVDDFGRIVNPLIAAGQVVGGSVQGIGQALLEEIRYDHEAGQLLSGSFMDYGIPRADDVSDLAVAFNESAPTPTNPLGVKGAGEAGATGAPPAVANAVMDALKEFGIRHLDMPLTPEKVWRAIHMKDNH